MFKIPDNNWNIIDKDIYKMLSEIYIEVSKDVFFPTYEKVLRFLENDIESIKVVIIGLDPYPSYVIDKGVLIPEATGRSFEVNSLNNWCDNFKQTSLRNILKAVYYNDTGKIKPLSDIRNEILSNSWSILPPGEWFDFTESQGVLWLNTSLTTKKDVPNSHNKYWDRFIKIVICRLNKQGVSYMLWGNDAISKIKPLTDNKCIECVHPRIASFVKENPFQHIDINWIGR